MHVFVCAVCMNMFVYPCRVQRSILALFLNHSPSCILRQDSHQTRSSLVPPHQCWVYRYALILRVYVGIEDLNSGPHPCVDRQSLSCRHLPSPGFGLFTYILFPSHASIQATTLYPWHYCPFTLLQDNVLFILHVMFPSFMDATEHLAEAPSAWMVCLG